MYCGIIYHDERTKLVYTLTTKLSFASNYDKTPVCYSIIERRYISHMPCMYVSMQFAGTLVLGVYTTTFYSMCDALEINLLRNKLLASYLYCTWCHSRFFWNYVTWYLNLVTVLHHNLIIKATSSLRPSCSVIVS